MAADALGVCKESLAPLQHRLKARLKRRGAAAAAPTRKCTRPMHLHMRRVALHKVGAIQHVQEATVDTEALGPDCASTDTITTGRAVRYTHDGALRNVAFACVRDGARTWLLQRVTHTSDKHPPLVVATTPKAARWHDRGSLIRLLPFAEVEDRQLPRHLDRQWHTKQIARRAQQTARRTQRAACRTW